MRVVDRYESNKSFSFEGLLYKNMDLWIFFTNPSQRWEINNQETKDFLIWIKETFKGIIIMSYLEL